MAAAAVLVCTHFSTASHQREKGQPGRQPDGSFGRYENLKLDSSIR